MIEQDNEGEHPRGVVGAHGVPITSPPMPPVPTSISTESRPTKPREMALRSPLAMNGSAQGPITLTNTEVRPPPKDSRRADQDCVDRLHAVLAAQAQRHRRRQEHHPDPGGRP